MSIHEQSVAYSVLILGQDDVTEFVTNYLRERSLSKILARLNQVLLNGTMTGRADAQKALKTVGFHLTKRVPR